VTAFFFTESTAMTASFSTFFHRQLLLLQLETKDEGIRSASVIFIK
jgi:hypothetical protein